jgi:leucyl/phenylalanyl-tRNA--protein transferase
VEVWSAKSGGLAGGLYGLALGGAFFAESKFHTERDASKIAVISLARRLMEKGFGLLEVQYLTEHLKQFGAVEISNREYLRRLQRALALDVSFPDPPPGPKEALE